MRLHLLGRRALLAAAAATAVGQSRRPLCAQGAQKLKLYLRMIGPRDGLADIGGALEAWIMAASKTRGIEDPRGATDWDEIGPRGRQTWRSDLGGRVVVVERTDDGAGDAAILRVTGSKIDPPRQEISIPQRPGAREFIELTRYPGARNMGLAAEIR